MVVRGDAVSVLHGHQDVREMVGDRYRRDTRSGDQDDRCAEGGKRKRQRERENNPYGTCTTLRHVWF